MRGPRNCASCVYVCAPSSIYLRWERKVIARVSLLWKLSPSGCANYVERKKKHKRRQCLCARAKITDREKTKQNAFRIGGCVRQFSILNVNCAFHRSSLPLIDAWSGCAKSVRSQLPLLVFLSLRPFPIKTHLWVAPFGAAGDALAAAAGNLFFIQSKRRF